MPVFPPLTDASASAKICVDLPNLRSILLPSGTACPGAPASVFGLRGGSPLQADALRPVFESNCVLVTGGGKQLEKNEQSVTKVNSIWPGCLASLPGNGEAQTDGSRKSMSLTGRVRKRSWEQQGCQRRNVRTAKPMKQGDLSGSGWSSCGYSSVEPGPPKSQPDRSQSVRSRDETG